MVQCGADSVFCIYMSGYIRVGVGLVWLTGNRLSGSIPASLAQCTKLVAFGCENNQLMGTFPCTILASCPFLTQIVLEGNCLMVLEAADTSRLAAANLTVLKL
jgi:hypothetical protein